MFIRKNRYGKTEIQFDPVMAEGYMEIPPEKIPQGKGALEITKNGILIRTPSVNDTNSNGNTEEKSPIENRVSELEEALELILSGSTEEGEVTE